MKTQMKWQRATISLAMITVGIGCFIARQVQGRPNSEAASTVVKTDGVMVYASEQASELPLF